MEPFLYNAYSDDLKKRYGEKVYKLPVNLPVSCPNRRKHRGGCAFCAENGTGFEAQENILTVTEQLQKNREHIEKRYHAHKFIAYFQNFTNTWLPLPDFECYMKEASEFPDLVEISISTRPDCLKREYLEVLKRIREATGIRITVELGLQTANYHTLNKMNRGHGLAAFVAGVLLLKEYQIPVCTHVILNLPGDTMEDVKETADLISALPVSMVKIHSLYISRNTKLSYAFEHGTISICSSEEYLDRLVFFVEHLRPDIVIERLFSRIPEADSIFSNWGKSWWVLMEEWKVKMQQQNSYQGKYYVPANEAAFSDVDEIGW